MNNYLKLKFSAKSENEGFARVAAAAFIASKNPTIEEMADIKTAVSEAVTNSIIHGYNGQEGMITMIIEINDKKITITIVDSGVGIEDIAQARTPLFTTKPSADRSGMGFTVMESFMDSLHIVSALNEGTTVIMTKTLH